MIRATLLLTAFLAAAPVYAGGPVIEDTAEPVPQTRLSPGEKIAIAAGLLLIIGLVAGGGGDNVCNGQDDTPTEPGC